MFNFLGITINATTIADAWAQLIWNVLPEGGKTYRQTIQRGSFEGEQFRYQFPQASIFIALPGDDMVPVIPDGLGIPSPTTMDYINDYFVNYLMNPDLGENETYKYASRIHHEVWLSPHMNDEKKFTFKSQINFVIEMLKKTPLTNQAVIEIASINDFGYCWGKDGKLDPPCLRLLDFKVIPYEGELLLTVSCYFRSWDLWAGLPTNLGGIELLKQFVAQEAGLINGPMYAYSAGLHVYGHHEDIVRIRTHQAKKAEPCAKRTTHEKFILVMNSDKRCVCCDIKPAPISTLCGEEISTMFKPATLTRNAPYSKIDCDECRRLVDEGNTNG